MRVTHDLLTLKNYLAFIRNHIVTSSNRQVSCSTKVQDQ